MEDTKVLGDRENIRVTWLQPVRLMATARKGLQCDVAKVPVYVDY